MLKSLVLITSILFSVQSKADLDIQKSKSVIDDYDNNLINVRFMNRREDVVDLYWINFLGQKQFFFTLDPGESNTLGTFIGHQFQLVSHSTNEVLREMEITKWTSSIVVHTEYPIVDSNRVQDNDDIKFLNDSRQKTKNKMNVQPQEMQSEFRSIHTAFEIFNLSTPDDFVVDPSLNKEMTKYAEDLYLRFIKDRGDGSPFNMDGVDSAILNHEFFRWQVELYEQNELHRREQAPESLVSTLMVSILQAVHQYLKRFNLEMEIIEHLLRNIEDGIDIDEELILDILFMWCTRMDNGQEHPAHDHRNSIVSGVYFAKIPDNKGAGGRLVFGDSGGFGMTHAHVPVEGQIVLFPGYLIHSVEPVMSKETRLSFAFNVRGSWEDLA